MHCLRVTCLGRLLERSVVALRQALHRFVMLGRIGEAHSQHGIVPICFFTETEATASILLDQLREMLIVER